MAGATLQGLVPVEVVAVLRGLVAVLLGLHHLRGTKKFSYKEVLLFGVATSIDALGTGVALHSGLSDNYTIFLHAAIIIAITFGICLIGLFLGGKIEKLLKGKNDITVIIGGVILLLLAVWIILSHYLGI